MKKFLLLMLFIALLISSCKKSSNSDGSTPNPEIKNYRIAKLMFDPPTSDSIVFSYLNNQLYIVTHYFYRNGGQVNMKSYYYYNADKTVSKVIGQQAGSNAPDTTYYVYQSNLLSKIIYRFKHDDYWPSPLLIGLFYRMV